MYIKIAVLSFILLGSIVFAATYGDGEYGCGFYGLGCSAVSSGPSGSVSQPEVTVSTPEVSGIPLLSIFGDPLGVGEARFPGSGIIVLVLASSFLLLWFLRKWIRQKLGVLGRKLRRHSEIPQEFPLR